jgi:hypothetical protein
LAQIFIDKVKISSRLFKINKKGVGLMHNLPERSENEVESTICEYPKRIWETLNSDQRQAAALMYELAYGIVLTIIELVLHQDVKFLPDTICGYPKNIWLKWNINQRINATHIYYLAYGKEMTVKELV